MKFAFCFLSIAWVACAVFPIANGWTWTLPRKRTTKEMHWPPLLVDIRSRTKSTIPRTELNAVAPEIWTNFLPPALGFLKSEWTFSYGYGFATSLSALSLLRRTGVTPSNPVFPVQASALIFYGIRLNLFLFIRNRISTRMQEFQKTMEERAMNRGSRLSRTPQIVGCGVLYFALYIPLLLTSRLSECQSLPLVALLTMKVLSILEWFGFLMGAVADATKSYVKNSKNDEQFLVTSGIFSLLRHPNYTGEIISWTCNSLLGTLAGVYLLRNKFSKIVIGYLGLGVVGWIGIVFVLLGATRSLEERQMRDYGDTEKYKAWVESTWSGWYLQRPSTQSSGLDQHEITMDEDKEEESGSGI